MSLCQRNARRNRPPWHRWDACRSTECSGGHSSVPKIFQENWPAATQTTTWMTVPTRLAKRLHKNCRTSKVMERAPFRINYDFFIRNLRILVPNHLGLVIPAAFPERFAEKTVLPGPDGIFVRHRRTRAIFGLRIKRGG